LRGYRARRGDEGPSEHEPQIAQHTVVHPPALPGI
jgi:hypothetical protein